MRFSHTSRRVAVLRCGVHAKLDAHLIEPRGAVQHRVGEIEDAMKVREGAKLMGGTGKLIEQDQISGLKERSTMQESEDGGTVEIRIHMQHDSLRTLKGF